jgi:hypothetical protein
VEADLDRPPRSYGVTETYEPGERIDHPNLGQGVVQMALGPQKISVLFGEDIKLLVHARPPKT